MSLRLSSTDVKAIEIAHRALLSPFAYESGEAWRMAAGEAVQACLGGDAVAFGLSLQDEPFIVAKPDVTAAMMKLVPVPDWLMRGLTLRRRQLGGTVIGWDDAFDYEALKQTPFYNDVARPQRLLAALLMVSDTGNPELPTTLAVMFDDERSAGRHSPRRKELLRLLSPAFETGVTTYFGFHRQRTALRSLLEDASIGVLYFDTYSLPGTENEFFRRLMEAEPERDRVRTEVTRQVRSIFRFSALAGVPPETRRRYSHIQTRIARYRVAAHFFDASSAGMTKAIAFVNRIESKPLDARLLDSHYSLTKRQIEIALLLRRGLSTADIAHDLRVSIHTARRHIEQVMLKLDVHTRAEAIAKLFNVG